MKHTITIDFETYYDDQYSLTEMTTSEYINSPLFEVIGFAYKLDDDPIIWQQGMNLLGEKAALLQLPWEDAVVVAHNAIFDGSILEWVYGIHPGRYFCTWQGAYPVIGAHVKSVSLANCAKFLGLGVKGTEVLDAKGKHRHDFTAEEMERYAAYCRNDVALTHKLYRVLNGWFRKNNVNVA